VESNRHCLRFSRVKATVHNVGRIGAINDVPAHELPPEAWSSAQNVTFRRGSVLKMQGQSQIYGTLLGDPYWLLQAFRDGAMYWIYPSLTKCYVTDGSSHKEITKSLTTYGATADVGWNGGILGGVPILNNGVDYPQMWDRDFATPGLLVDLTNWPANVYCRCMRVHKNYLFAMDVTEAGTRYEDVVRWSHPAEPGAVPASWDYTDATKDAGRTTLSETPGAVLDGMTLGSIFVLYKENGVWGAQEVGSREIFRFWPMFTQISVMSRRCIALVAEPAGRRHLVLTQDADLVLHDGSGAASIAERRWRKWLQDNIDSTNYQRCYIAVDRANREAWICVPTSGSSFADRALVWNMKENTFGVRELPTARAAEWGIASTTTNETWDADAAAWDTDLETWDARAFSARAQRLMLCQQNKILRVGGTETFDGTAMTAFVERQGLALIGRKQDGSPVVDFQRRKFLRRIWLEMQSTGPVNVYGLAQEYKDGPVSYLGPKSFDPATQKYVDVAGSGRLLGIRIESSTDISWQLDGYELEIEIGGRF